MVQVPLLVNVTVVTESAPSMTKRGYQSARS
jgi:hypothetical protein